MIVATSSQPNIRTGALGSRLNVGSINVYHSTNRLSGQKSVTTLTVEEAQDLKRPMYKKVCLLFLSGRGTRRFLYPLIGLIYVKDLYLT